MEDTQSSAVLDRVYIIQGGVRTVLERVASKVDRVYTVHNKPKSHLGIIWLNHSLQLCIIKEACMSSWQHLQRAYFNSLK